MVIKYEQSYPFLCGHSVHTKGNRRVGRKGRDIADSEEGESHELRDIGHIFQIFVSNPLLFRRSKSSERAGERAWFGYPALPFPQEAFRSVLYAIIIIMLISK